MARGRPLPPLTLTEDERATLQGWTRRRTTAQALAQRARVVLECAAGKSNRAVARDVRRDEDTVGKWRRRFLATRVDGLLDEPRPGAPRTITDAEGERVVTLTLESTPRDATHWSTRGMAARCGLSQSTVGRIWRAFGLQPHRTDTSSCPATRSSSTKSGTSSGSHLWGALAGPCSKEKTQSHCCYLAPDHERACLCPCGEQY